MENVREKREERRRKKKKTDCHEQEKRKKKREKKIYFTFVKYIHTILDISSLLVSFLFQPYSRSIDSLAWLRCRTCPLCKLQMEQCCYNHHLDHHKFWIRKELEWMRFLLRRRLCRHQLCRNLIFLVHVEANHRGRSHISIFPGNLQRFRVRREYKRRNQCCWCTFHSDMVLELGLHLGM